MLGYGVIVDNSLGERLLTAFRDTLAFIGNLPGYWYGIALAVAFLLYLLLIRK